ncbi:hypothetical protein [Paenibacillus apiarius]|uniref:Coat protein n=1 Tax=Paenibacillus apiarius TaxID=46240 RepID=A0ABT4DPG5_9BACL|nr:hypothetical protein [Paenibacillus apiarius]MCY9517196.1 hypothetical protein [Paenibacillus apiarius]MCY9519209.1 hypothetical protein [Paenibacillus apiarius]MCY9555137.1 hypothetical protein [Paenibacillus apiarius]MCY9559995.1 hypothetical protein [Paenibacillus apiarius]MCY9683362.1 hypothetical protein [Paenibacillus apiarius]
MQERSKRNSSAHKNRMKKSKRGLSKYSQTQPIVRNGGFESGTLFPWSDVGDVTVRSGLPRRGSYYALILASPSGSSSLSQRITLDRSRSYLLSIYVARTSRQTTGTLVVSLSNSVLRPLIVPLSDIELVRYGYKLLNIPANSLTTGNNILRIELNGGGTTAVSVALDDVRIAPR